MARRGRLGAHRSDHRSRQAPLLLQARSEIVASSSPTPAEDPRCYVLIVIRRGLGTSPSRRRVHVLTFKDQNDRRAAQVLHPIVIKRSGRPR
jgi:hypothetical protein